jgi:hypothetical protein
MQRNKTDDCAGRLFSILVSYPARPGTSDSGSTLKTGSALHFALLANFVFCSLADAAPAPPTPLEIDLSLNASTTEQSVQAGTYQVVLTNLIPGRNYTIKVAEHTNTIPIPSPFTVPNAPPPGTKPPPGGVAVAAAPTACEKAEADANTTLQAQTSEAQVKALLDKNSTKGILQQLAAAGCSTAELDAAAKNLANASSQLLAPVTIGPNQVYTVQVTRLAAGTATAATFGPYTYDGPTPLAGQWLTYYGFNFIKSGDQQFYSKQSAGTPTTYTVTQESNRTSSMFAPSIYFMWIPGDDKSYYPGWASANSFGGPVAGLGFDFSNPVVFAGYGVGWGYNVTVTAGVAMHKEERLLGQYNGGETVTTNLTESQLTQQVYRPEAYIGLAFRFGSNPFQASTSPGGKTPATPAPPTSPGTPVKPAK